MDVFTHIMIGAAASSPFWVTHPLESVAFTFGSMIPDIDALSRSFGKVAYLRAHQGWTHAIPVHIGICLAAIGVLGATDLHFLIPSVAALGLGAVIHSLLDWTNTWGVRLFAPFRSERRCLEWVFFIDAVVIVATAGTLIGQLFLLHSHGTTSPALAAVWIAGVSLYVTAKAVLRHRAGRLADDAAALIPSAVVPWHFYGMTPPDPDGTVTTFLIDARDGRRRDEREHHTLDDGWAERLVTVDEFAAMRELSRGYHVVESDGDRVVCRDLRTRNALCMGFGRLVLSNELTVEQFDV